MNMTLELNEQFYKLFNDHFCTCTISVLYVLYDGIASMRLGCLFLQVIINILVQCITLLTHTSWYMPKNMSYESMAFK